MARRMVIGYCNDGSYDVRISRDGVDAYYADYNDRHAVSFSARRDGMAKLAAAGEVAALNSAVGFTTAFGDVPVVGHALKRSGQVIMDEYNRATGGSGRYQDGQPYCAVVTSSWIMFTNPMQFAYGLPSGDKFIFMAIA